MNDGRPTGALVISLDFELHWGVRDHTAPDAPYARNLLGAREVIPRILELFRRYEVAATWATVGFLFAESRRDLDRFRPATLPAYEDARLRPYDEPVGEGEADDPLHFAPGLIEAIRGTPRQEVGTHTYSHYFCNEPGQTLETFRADIEAAVAIAAARGIPIRSIVFPRNQVNPAYADVLRQCGLVAYRGNPTSWMWTFRDRDESANLAKRLARAADDYLPVGDHGGTEWSEIPRSDGLADVRASRVVRPFVPALRALEPLRRRRMRAAIRDAARRGQVMHLWWHPHNFGAHPDGCLAFLEDGLREFAECRERYGMRSLTMAEAAAEAFRLAGRPLASGGAVDSESATADREIVTR